MKESKFHHFHQKADRTNDVLLAEDSDFPAETFRTPTLLLAGILVMLFSGIFTDSIKRAAESSSNLSSSALIQKQDYEVEPEKLGKLLFENAGETLSVDDVEEIASGFARAKKEDEDWVERFVDSYSRERLSTSSHQ